MSTKDTLENMARNTWLAGLGSIDSSKEALAKSIDVAQEKSNNLYNELLTRGEKIQSQIFDKKDEIQAEIQAKGKKFLGLSAEKSDEEKLAQLNTAVDHLTSVVANLIEKRNAAEAEAAEAAAEAAAAAAPEATAPEATAPAAAPAPKAVAAPVTKSAKTAEPKAATATKSAAKPVTKASNKKQRNF